MVKHGREEIRERGRWQLEQLAYLVMLVVESGEWNCLAIHAGTPCPCYGPHSAAEARSTSKLEQGRPKARGPHNFPSSEGTQHGKIVSI